MNPKELTKLATVAEVALLGRIAELEAALEAKHQQYTGAVIQLEEARKDGERLSALQDGRLSTQYRDGATKSMDKWIVTYCATPIAGGSTLRAAIDNATAARGAK